MIPEGVETFDRAEALMEKEDFDAVWIASFDEPFAFETARKVRGNFRYALVPLFFDGPVTDRLRILGDGSVSHISDLRHKAAAILERSVGLDLDALRKESGLRLLAFLFLRPGRTLEPYRDWRYEDIYRYLLADLFNESGIETSKAIEMLTKRGLLERRDLIDRIRLCPACGKPHHNFVDVCPEDGTLKIEKEEFIHCFTCGYVGPEEEFYKEGVYICPNCKTVLRHIGVDYDRPLESYLCEHGHKFVEPDVVAECLSCGATNPTDSLQPFEIYTYGITVEGELAVRSGEITDIYAMLDRINYMHPDTFTSMVDWLLKLHRRTHNDHFALLLLKLSNITDLVDRIGRGKVAEFLDGFAERLRELLRTTDMTTRTNETEIWILLPKTDRKGCQTVVRRVEDLKTLVTVGGEGLDFDLACFGIDSQAEEQLPENAKEVMAYLRAQIFSMER